MTDKDLDHRLPASGPTPTPQWAIELDEAIERGSSRSPTAKSQVRLNAEQDPTYRPYCMRCDGLVRMQIVEPFYWRCACGAEHDERRSPVEAGAPGEATVRESEQEVGKSGQIGANRYDSVNRTGEKSPPVTEEAYECALYYCWEQGLDRERAWIEGYVAQLRARVSQLEATVAEAVGWLSAMLERREYEDDTELRHLLDALTQGRPERASSLNVPGSSQDVAVQALTAARLSAEQERDALRAVLEGIAERSSYPINPYDAFCEALERADRALATRPTVVADPSVPPGEVHIRDSASGKLLGKIVDVE